MTKITYDTDACATPATLGYDVVKFADGKAHRLGTYSTRRRAEGNMPADESVEVIYRG